MRKCFGFTTILVFQFLSFSLADTIHIPEQFTTIQAGLDAAAEGDTVLLDPGLYHGECNRDLDFRGKDLVLRSRDNDPSTCLIACQGTYWESHRGIIFQGGESPAAVVEGLTISGGYVDYSLYGGGGILCSDNTNSRPTIRNCRITECFSADLGGGLLAYGGGVTIEDCRFDNNRASEDGSAAAIGGPSPSLISGCLFDHNGVGLSYSRGLVIDGPGSVIFECVFADNDNVALVVPENGYYSKLTVVGNEVGVEALDADIFNSIIAFNGSAFGPLDFALLSCCNIFGNENGDWLDHFEGQLGIRGNIAQDPLFCDTQSWDYHLAPESPCLEGFCGQIGAMGAGECSNLSPAEEPLSARFGIQGNYPNPFNPITTIRYHLPQDSPVRLDIFDLGGRLVRNLVDSPTAIAGAHEAVWQGRDSNNRMVSAGVYLAVLQTDMGRDTRSLALIK